MAGAAGLAAEVALDGLAGLEHGLGVERGADRDGGVEERGLVEHLPHRLGLVDRRAGEHVDAAGRQGVDGVLQVPAPVAKVAPRARGSPPLGPRLHSSGSRQTSTETSSTGSGIGGSGLAALTQTLSAPNCSSSRSAIAAHRRSSVR